MSKDFMKKLESISKEFADKNYIFDVILYGSIVKGKENPNDTDILLLFVEKPLKERIEIAQKFKNKIKGLVNKPHIEIAILRDFFDKSYFARQSFLAEGISLLTGETISRKLGFRGYSLFSYTLENLDHNKKTKFTYALIGRKGSGGAIKIVSAERLGRGSLLVPTAQSSFFEEFLITWGVNYKKKQILVSEI